MKVFNGAKKDYNEWTPAVLGCDNCPNKMSELVCFPEYPELWNTERTYSCRIKCDKFPYGVKCKHNRVSESYNPHRLMYRVAVGTTAEQTESAYSFYINAKDLDSAKSRASNCFPWLKVYSVEECTEDEAITVLTNPAKYYYAQYKANEMRLPVELRKKKSYNYSLKQSRS